MSHKENGEYTFGLSVMMGIGIARKNATQSGLVRMDYSPGRLVRMDHSPGGECKEKAQKPNF